MGRVSAVIILFEWKGINTIQEIKENGGVTWKSKSKLRLSKELKKW